MPSLAAAPMLIVIWFAIWGTLPFLLFMAKLLPKAVASCATKAYNSGMLQGAANFYER